jgi:hypothetical protein
MIQSLSVVQLVGKRWPDEHGGHVIEELEPAIEDPAVYHLERHIGIVIEDPIPARDAGDDGEDHHPEAVHQPGAKQRPAEGDAAEGARSGRVPSRFMARTAATGSSSTSSVLAHDSGGSSVEENTTLGIAVRSASSSGVSAAKPDINRYVVAPIRAVCSSCSLSQPRYSGPSIPQKPGHPSAAPYPSREMMKSTMRFCIAWVLSPNRCHNR